MTRFDRLVSAADIPPGKGIKVKYRDTYIAVFNYRGKFYAIQNRCPHQGADLADGYIRNNQVYCPVHNWAFHLISGSFAFNPAQKLKTYDILVQNGDIFILNDSRR